MSHYQGTETIPVSSVVAAAPRIDLETMNEKPMLLTTRGIDNIGVFAKRPVTVRHCCLKIVDW